MGVFVGVAVTLFSTPCLGNGDDPPSGWQIALVLLNGLAAAVWRGTQPRSWGKAQTYFVELTNEQLSWSRWHHGWKGPYAEVTRVAVETITELRFDNETDAGLLATIIIAGPHDFFVPLWQREQALTLAQALRELRPELVTKGLD